MLATTGLNLLLLIFRSVLATSEAAVSRSVGWFWKSTSAHSPASSPTARGFKHQNKMCSAPLPMLVHSHWVISSLVGQKAL